MKKQIIKDESQVAVAQLPKTNDFVIELKIVSQDHSVRSIHMIEEQTPRFEVIADYPNSIYKVGDILELVRNTTNKYFHTDQDAIVGNFFTESELLKYPHIFRKLTTENH